MIGISEALAHQVALKPTSWQDWLSRSMRGDGRAGLGTAWPGLAGQRGAWQRAAALSKGGDERRVSLIAAFHEYPMHSSLPEQMTDRYILKGKKPVRCPDLIRWAMWMETTGRTVRLSIQGDVSVSTVFLGLDHGHGRGPPLLFETIAFIDDQSQGCERYSTWAEAEAGHRRWVSEVFKPTPIPSLPKTCG